MRKLLLAVLILVMIAVPSVYADDVTVDLAGGVKANSGLGTELGIGFGTWGGNSSFIFSLGIDAEADIFFNAHHGMYVGAGFLLNIQNGTNVAYDVGIGYAYKEYFDDFNLIVIILASAFIRDDGQRCIGTPANAYAVLCAQPFNRLMVVVILHPDG